MKDVELTIDNYTKCVCPVCPVQARSECVAAKRSKWERVRLAVGTVLAEYPSHPEAYGMDMQELEDAEVGKRSEFAKPVRGEMIELYCSKAVGSSDCKDLGAHQRCQCPTCAVWASHQLDSTFYCL